MCAVERKSEGGNSRSEKTSLRPLCGVACHYMTVAATIRHISSGQQLKRWRGFGYRTPPPAVRRSEFENPKCRRRLKLEVGEGGMMTFRRSICRNIIFMSVLKDSAKRFAFDGLVWPWHLSSQSDEIEPDFISFSCRKIESIPAIQVFVEYGRRERRGLSPKRHNRS